MIAAALAFACAGRMRGPDAMPPLPFTADTIRSSILRSGVTQRFIYAASGPWAIHVLDVELGRCNSALAAKGPGGAIGREKTSDLLRRLAATHDIIGGVNADFFSLSSPPGVPTGTLISNDHVITGPSEQPVLAFLSSGRAQITTLRATGVAQTDGARLEIAAWNRRTTNALALFDARWSAVTDTASSVVEVVLSGAHPRRVLRIDTTRSGVSIPPDGVVLIAGRDAPAETRTALLMLRPGDTVRTDVSMTPVHPREAVGGRPALARDSAVLAIVDTEGQPGFATGRHPRTAAGLARDGRRLILVVVDGRQAPYSDGMTLRELANLMLALGARDAINLDGGGSTTMVYAPRDSAGMLRIANRPSDPTGERTVGDALAIASSRRCAGPGSRGR